MPTLFEEVKKESLMCKEHDSLYANTNCGYDQAFCIINNIGVLAISTTRGTF